MKLNLEKLVRTASGLAEVIKAKALEKLGYKKCGYCGEYKRDVAGGLCKYCDLSGAYMSGNKTRN